jgi:predicted nucleic acid-binding protein
MPPQLYFADTWFLVARFSRFDESHSEAVAINRRLPQASFVTHDGVLAEFLAFVSGWGAVHRAGAEVSVREVLRRWIVFPSDRALFLRALDLYGERLDKAYSLVDCMSMMLMKAQGITTILTNDHHFAQEGFTLLNA